MSLGAQNRAGTFTGQLGFLNPHDKRDKPQFKASWENWRDKSLPVAIIDNEPTEGFVINRNAGGKHSGWYWDQGREAKIRVWDPRRFEIEITIPNLLYLLEQTNSFKGKGLEGQLVYGWNGSQLVLVPIDSEEYKGSIEYTDLQCQKVSTKSLTEGATILTKHEERMIYIGRYEIVKPNKNWGSGEFSVGKEHIFYNEGTKKFEWRKMENIAKILDNECSSEFSNLVEKYQLLEWEFPYRKLVIDKSVSLSEYSYPRYSSKEPNNMEISRGLVFILDNDVYRGYRIIQKYKPKMYKYFVSGTQHEATDGWQSDGFIMENSLDIKIEEGVNKIFPGKEEPKEMKTLESINRMHLLQIKTYIEDARNVVKLRVLG